MKDRTSRPEIIRIIALAVTLLVVVCSPSASLQAQERTGNIYGRVVDSSGGIIAGATVTITDSLTGLTRVVITNDDGNYSAPKLQTGTYTVDAELIGFKKFQRTGLVLGAGTVAEVNIALEVGETTETVEVTAAQPLVNTTSGAVRTMIDQVFLDRVPLRGRNSNDLIKLAPGVTAGVGGGDVIADNYSVNGNRDTSNNFTLDGTDNSDVFNSKSSRMPPPDALKEFTVQSNYSAEYGRGGGVAVIALTKSGTNQLHGSVYDYFRGENLDANSFQSNALGLKKADFKRHQWGFTVGGPTVLPKIYDGRNKTFFFFSYQRLSTPSNSYLWRRGGLTAAELAGDFSQSAIIPKVSTAAAAQPNSPFAGMAGQSIPNLSRYLSSAAVRWYQIFKLPLVEKSGASFFENRTQSLSQPESTLRIDHSLSQKHTFSFSLFYRKDFPEVTKINRAPEAFSTVDRYSNAHYTLSDVWTISSGLVNEIMVGYNRIHGSRVADFGGVDYTSLGLPYPSPSARQLVGIKDILSPGDFTLEAPNGKYELRDLYDYRDTLSVIRGTHFMKLGAMVQIQNITAENYANQEFAYSGNWLGNRAAEFLIGWPQSMGALREPFYKPVRRNVAHLFFQDDWKVSPRLALNLGIRYEPHLWAYLKNDKSLLFIPGAQSRYTNFPSGVVTVTDSASPGRSGRTNDMNNFAPRLGAAYRLDDRGRTVIRGGWGVYFDTLPAGGRDGAPLSAQFPFLHSYSTTFNRGYPGSPNGWLNIFAYDGVPIPDLSKPVNLSTATFVPNTAYGIYRPDDDRMGYVHQFNLTLEQEFLPGWTYSAGYVGSRGRNLTGVAFWNVPVSRDASDSYNVENLASRRPIQQYRLHTRSFDSPNSESSYHAAQFTLKANTSSFHLLSHYTYSRTFAHTDGVLSTGFARSHPDNLDVDWARALMDIPNNLLVMSSWDLPVFRGRRDLVGKILGDWTATSVLQVQSGRPVNIVAAQNNTFTCQGCVVRPNATGQPLINEGWRKDPNLVYVNSAAFSQPADRTFGNLERNAVRWPYSKNVDLGLGKSFALFREDVKLDLKVDFSNLFNWVNFSSPNEINLGSSPITRSMKSSWTRGPRTLQFGARIAF